MAFLVSEGYVYRIALHFLYQKVMFTELHCISCIRRLCLQNCTAFLVSEGYVYRIAWHFLYRMVMFIELHRIFCIVTYFNMTLWSTILSDVLLVMSQPHDSYNKNKKFIGSRSMLSQRSRSSVRCAAGDVPTT